jgi:mannose-1-phosphate guanylyltransferase
MLSYRPVELPDKDLWSVVLAAGDGKRLQRYVRQLCGKELPKQYVNFIGRRSMLEHTFDRAEKLIAKERILTIVARHHLAHDEVRRQLSSRPANNVIVQPANKETGPGILLPLLHLYKRNADAVVAVFPSDHFILREENFAQAVRLAARAVREIPQRIILLAVKPQDPETEYGYILARDDSDGSYRFGTCGISAFVEKPDADLANELVTTGGLWNTMIMVFKLKTLLDLFRTLLPGIYFNFGRVLDAIGSPREQRMVNEVYDLLEPVNFSKGIMEQIAARFPEQLAALAVRDVVWSDWGSEERILRTIQKLRPNRDAEPPRYHDRREA